MVVFVICLRFVIGTEWVVYKLSRSYERSRIRSLKMTAASPHRQIRRDLRSIDVCVHCSFRLFHHHLQDSLPSVSHWVLNCDS